MHTLRTHRLLLVVAILLVVQVPWYFLTMQAANRTLVKTTATVMGEGNYGSNCPGNSRSLCDRSPVIAPVYQYHDTTGTIYTQSDQYLGGYKRNNPLIHLFGKKVGDTVTAYYSKDNPRQVTFMSGPIAYTALLTPLYLAIVVMMAAGVWRIYRRFRDWHNGY